MIEIVSLIVSAIVMMCAIVTLVVTVRKNNKDRDEEYGQILIEIRHISSRLDRYDTSFDELRKSDLQKSIDIAKCDQSCKSAHHRIDRLEDRFDAHCSKDLEES